MNGAPVARPMFFSFPEDPRFATTDDQFMFGDSLLVAPVMEAGATKRTVLLPKGTWFDFATGEPHEGGGLRRLGDPVLGAAAVRGREDHRVLELTAFVIPGEHESVSTTVEAGST